MTSTLWLPTAPTPTTEKFVCAKLWNSIFFLFSWLVWGRVGCVELPAGRLLFFYHHLSAVCYRRWFPKGVYCRLNVFTFLREGMGFGRGVWGLRSLPPRRQSGSKQTGFTAGRVGLDLSLSPSASLSNITTHLNKNVLFLLDSYQAQMFYEGASSVEPFHWCDLRHV